MRGAAGEEHYSTRCTRCSAHNSYSVLINRKQFIDPITIRFTFESAEERR
jgi:hypothetical protein